MTDEVPPSPAALPGGIMINGNDYNRQLIEEFRANRDKTGGPFEGRPLLLLTTTGAKSGARRTTPMMYIPDGERLLVIASNIGAPVHPDWYHNLVAHPDVTVEVGTETFEATAVVMEGAERDRLWSRIVASYPFFAEHQAKTTRQIPVIALKRRAGTGSSGNMPGEARQYAVVLERIARHALAQFADISDADLNRPLALPESNTALVLATHLIGSAEYWVLELVGGRDMQRDRSAEFRATGTGAEVAARYERWLIAMRELLQTLPEERLDQPVRVPAHYHPALDEEPITARAALLHAIEHAALHQGHLELTRQLLGYAPAGAE